MQGERGGVDGKARELASTSPKIMWKELPRQFTSKEVC
jgi:hypothetical protein